MSHEQKLKDFKVLYEKYGADPNDFCGASCNTEMYFRLLEDPTKRKAKGMLSEFITVYFTMGAEGGRAIPADGISVLDAEEYEIYKRNGDIKT